jgi:hypothetical protein
MKANDGNFIADGKTTKLLKDTKIQQYFRHPHYYSTNAPPSKSSKGALLKQK